jgi:hypothetical protein
MSTGMTQLSAAITVETKEKLDRFTDELGLKKNFVVEQALLHFMEARRALPDEALAPARIVLENKPFDAAVEAIERAASPTGSLAGRPG